MHINPVASPAASRVQGAVDWGPVFAGFAACASWVPAGAWPGTSPQLLVQSGGTPQCATHLWRRIGQQLNLLLALGTLWQVWQHNINYYAVPAYCARIDSIGPCATAMLHRHRLPALPPTAWVPPFNHPLPQTVYQELDVDGEMAKGLLPGLLALGAKLGPTVRVVTKRTAESAVQFVSSAQVRVGAGSTLGE